MNPTSKSHLNAIDSQVARQSLLLHPFYECWTRGDLTMDALRDYATQYYHHVAAFPTYLSALHSHTEDLAVRRQILNNLVDEEAGDPNHPELWLAFSESLGVTNDTVRTTKLWKETENLISTYRSICRDCSTAEGLAALYAYESQIPSVAESKISGLVRFYGIDQPKGLEYFRVHIEADREHSRVERALLESLIDVHMMPAVTNTVDKALNALSEMLSGVCRRHEIAC